MLRFLYARGGLSWASFDRDRPSHRDRPLDQDRVSSAGVANADRDSNRAADDGPVGADVSPWAETAIVACRVRPVLRSARAVRANRCPRTAGTSRAACPIHTVIARAARFSFLRVAALAGARIRAA